ncbi:hypothetical protein [Maledivibacter halophilus]|uniref:Uncharacterized protein n=1 Tax=Maledivibacter halophilus TaxID=36842 RepID=A0A1T5MHZ6_9FIRM|nr:hypothetical protein [Maledivibacter halophilus]SKC87830.1 hypothetical protein SAMN02194393_04756 [Maledivibacter halophilus]
MNKIEKIKKEIANGNLNLNAIDIEKTFIKNPVKENSTHLMSSSEEDEIMDVLYNEGLLDTGLDNYFNFN